MERIPQRRISTFIKEHTRPHDKGLGLFVVGTGLLVAGQQVVEQQFPLAQTAEGLLRSRLFAMPLTSLAVIMQDTLAMIQASPIGSLLLAGGFSLAIWGLAEFVQARQNEQ